MLEFCKKVLAKVSFDRALFAKELKKSMRWLKRAERESLKQWCSKKYGDLYGDIILTTFSNPALV